jgi:polysaccharide pyruvyl transferase CsaB
MPTFLISGYYGAGNLGDEAILTCMLDDLRAIDGDLKFVVTSWDPEATQAQYGVQAVHWKNIDALFEIVPQVDLVILGGGGLFHDYWGLDPSTYLRASAWDITAYGSLPLLARLNNVPAMIYAVGLGPFKTSTALQHTRYAFENCQAVTLRDQASLALLEKSGYFTNREAKPIPQVLADPVFSLTASLEEDRRAAEYLAALSPGGVGKLAAVSLRYWDLSAGCDGWLEKIANGVSGFLQTETDLELLLIPFQSNPENAYTDDTAVIDGFTRLLDTTVLERVHVVREPITPGFAQALFKRCVLVLGMRLHSLILGINAGTPIVGLSYDPKVTSLMQAAGLEEYCPASLDLDPVELTNLLIKAIQDSDSIRQKCRIFRENSIRSARKNAEVAYDLAKSMPRTPRSFIQSLTVQQAKIIHELDDIIEHNSGEINRLHQQLNSSWQSYAALQQERERQAEKNAGQITLLLQQITRLQEQLTAQAQTQQALQKEYEQQAIVISTLRKERDESSIAQVKLHEVIQSSERTIALQNSSLSLLREKTKDLEEQRLVQDARLQSLQAQMELERTENQRQTEQNWALTGQLNSIYTSKAWGLIKRYYTAVEQPPLRSLRRLFRRAPATASSNSTEITVMDPRARVPIPSDSEIINQILQTLNERRLKGLFIVTSTLEFDRFYNQRVINLTRYLSDRGWGVIFVAWRWSKNDAFHNYGTEVYKNAFQIPVDAFLENQSLFSRVTYANKYLVLEFPYPGFLTAGLELNNIGYRVVYDIIDDWEEFARVGQSAWYDRQMEQAVALNADRLFAVSQPLAEKFCSIRQDITLLPNGFDPVLLGKQHANIATKSVRQNEVHIGYFGHLTDSWFDWELIFSVADLAACSGIELQFHLIGYGQPENKERLQSYADRIHFHGRVDPDKLYLYAQNWDLAMIPFKPGKLAQAVDPIKVYEYRFFGLPVIVTGIEHLSERPGVKVVANAGAFLTAVDELTCREASNNGKGQKLLRKLMPARPSTHDPSITPYESEIEGSTWDSRFDKLLSSLETQEWIF